MALMASVVAAQGVAAAGAETFGAPVFSKSLGGILLAADKPADFSPNPLPALNLAWTREAGSLTLVRAERIVWQFNYGAAAAKPFFHPEIGRASWWERV